MQFKRILGSNMEVWNVEFVVIEIHVIDHFYGIDIDLFMRLKSSSTLS